MIQLSSYLDVLKKRPQNEEFVKIRWHNCNVFQKKIILAKKKKKKKTVISYKNNLVTYWYRTKEWNGWFSAIKVINWCTSFSSTENIAKYSQPKWLRSSAYTNCPILSTLPKESWEQKLENKTKKKLRRNVPYLFHKKTTQLLIKHTVNTSILWITFTRNLSGTLFIRLPFGNKLCAY